ncbi:DUF3750 domain-containing protein, partial [Patescibacteria group bacterium AH-259-L07]|nr:DUF3750 domain-containing protein [Patescibacteria group bacterium AH-259-L07]
MFENQRSDVLASLVGGLLKEYSNFVRETLHNKQLMNSDDFKKLVKSSGYQVFLFMSPSTPPFSFAVHPWFVCVKNGEISRWDLLFRKAGHKTHWGHLYLNFLPPLTGMEIMPFWNKYHWRGKLVKLVGHIGGDESSVAKRMVDFIENSKETYPYCHKYFLTGPNCSTFAQWVLNNFPESKIEL